MFSTGLKPVKSQLIHSDLRYLPGQLHHNHQMEEKVKHRTTRLAGESSPNKGHRGAEQMGAHLGNILRDLAMMPHALPIPP